MVFDRFKEKFRQGSGLSADMHHFKSTDNARVDKTMKEAEAFGAKLKSWKKHFVSYHSSTASMLHTTQKTLAGELPLVHDMDDATGKAVPRSQPNNAESSLQLTSFGGISTTHEQRLNAEVMQPIDRWLATLKDLEAKLKTLDNHRLDFDTARRMHNRADLDRVRQQQKHDTVDDATVAALQEKESDLNVKRQQWSQFEQQVHSELAELLSEAGNMHVHLANALRVEADHLTAALTPGGSGVTQQMGGMGLGGGQGGGYPGLSSGPALSGGKPLPSY